MSSAKAVSQDLLLNSNVDRLGEDGASTDRTSGSTVQQPERKSNKPCRFYRTKAGCRAGDKCRYQHVDVATNQTESSTTTTDATHRTTSSLGETRHPGRSQKPNPVRKSPVVTKPISKIQQSNPREFQIGQVIRRYKPIREESENTTILSLNIVPTDPDFPFELDKLQCRLIVPGNWPGQTKPTLQVNNADIPKGYQINIERGFDSLIVQGKTLLGLLNDLDRHLERFLASEKAQTIKIIANRRKPDIPIVEKMTPKPIAVESVSIPVPTWSHEQKILAKVKRDNDIRQLEARMGRLPLFSTSDDKTWFNIPINYAKPAQLPVALQPIKEVVLFVPLLYDLEPCSIRLKGVYGQEAENVESAFTKYAAEHHESTLMAHVNYLTQHLHELAVHCPDEAVNKVDSQLAETRQSDGPAVPKNQTEGVIDEDRPHLIFLSRPPPEWNRGTSTSDASDSSSEEYTTSENDQTSGDEGAEGGGAAIDTPTATASASASASSSLEKGILFSFPHLEMTGIELLQVQSLSLSVKCDRCKTSLEIKNITSSSDMSINTITRTETCTKCANSLSARYKSDFIHANSIKAGSIDLEGCTIQDMLPSEFQPTCSECSTTQTTTTTTTTTAVRGDTTLIICRTCHKKLTLSLPEVKFLRVSTTDRINRDIKPKRRKENLGITSGTELPLRGSCRHYAKSYRWFRFSCCNRVYACDRCHDEAESHDNEHANRMICGWCSREQNYRPEDCQFCQRSVTRKTGGGFWEGGKGTRDQVKMNRNDPRKYKRIGGTTAGDKKKS